MLAKVVPAHSPEINSAVADRPVTEIIQHSLKMGLIKILYLSISAGSLTLATFQEQTTVATKTY